MCDAKWGGVKNMYGPTWFYLSLLVHKLSFSVPYINLVLLKLSLVIIFIFSGILTSKIVKKIKPDFEKVALFLFLWNPLIIFEVASSGHNDILLIFFVIVAFYFLIQNKYFWTFIFLLFSVLVKYITLPILFGFIIYYLFSKPKEPRRFVKIIIYFLIGIGLIVLLFGPIWGGLQTFDGVFDQGTRLNTAKNSPLFSIIYLLDIKILINNFFIVSAILYFIIYSLLLFWLIKSPKKPINFFKFTFWVLFFMLLFLFTWLMSWYFIWIIPVAILAGYKKWALIFTFIGLAAYPIPIFILIILLIVFGLIYYLFQQHKKNDKIE